MLQLVNLSKHFQGRYLFQNVSWQVRDSERIGLCGPNGCGKTTLLRMLSGEVPPDDGQIAVPRGSTIGYLPQDVVGIRGRRLIDEMRTAFAELLSLQAEQQELEARMADTGPDDEQLLELTQRYDEVQHRFRDGGGFQMDGQIAQVLLGLGFTQEDFERDCGHFSGGWQMRIALARLLLARPDVLLLDEPTNHLDIEARDWLQGFLRAYPYSVVLVSHDRYFLDAVVDRITDVSPLGLLDFTGGYSKYVENRDAHFERMAAHNERIRKEVERLTTMADRFGAKATKAAQAQTWRKQAEKLEGELVPLPPPRDSIGFRFPPAPHSGKIAMTVEGVSRRYGDKLVFEGANFVIERGERVALVGVNGAGKTTLMRLLAGERPTSGEVRPGHQVELQYFAQDQSQHLNLDNTVYEEVLDGAPTEAVPRLRNMLGAFLFSGDDVHKPVRVLSGGERNRLALLKMLLRPANLLLLDEPTNHLDIDSKDVLLEALQQFEGTILFVSHDRYFVEQLATKVIEVADGQVAVFPGGYHDYLWKKSRQPVTEPVPAGASPGVAAPPAPTDRETEKARRMAEREARKAAEAEERRRLKRVAEIEAAIEATEARIGEIEHELTLPDVFSDAERTAALARELDEARAEEARLMKEWEQIAG